MRLIVLEDLRQSTNEKPNQPRRQNQRRCRRRTAAAHPTLLVEDGRLIKVQAYHHHAASLGALLDILAVVLLLESLGCFRLFDAVGAPASWKDDGVVRREESGEPNNFKIKAIYIDNAIGRYGDCGGCDRLHWQKCCPGGNPTRIRNDCSRPRSNFQNITRPKIF
jgi:hypothetical protein